MPREEGEGLMGAGHTDLQERTLQLAVRVLRLRASLPDTVEARMICSQLIRCGTSPGAQYREACRARSPAEFISKIESAQQELDETIYWFDLLERSEVVTATRLRDIRREANELLSIFAASAKTAKNNNRKPQ